MRPATAVDVPSAEDIENLINPPSPVADNDYHLKRDLELLETGEDSDVTVTCGSKSWELHKHTLKWRSRFFEKALAEHHQETTRGVVNIEKQEPEALGLALTYVYGGAAAVDMAKETANRPVVRFCVDVYRAATILDLHSDRLQQIIRQHLEGHLDQKLKWLFTRGNVDGKVKDEDADGIRLGGPATPPDWLD